MSEYVYVITLRDRWDDTVTSEGVCASFEVAERLIQERLDHGKFGEWKLKFASPSEDAIKAGCPNWRVYETEIGEFQVWMEKVHG